MWLDSYFVHPWILTSDNTDKSAQISVWCKRFSAVANPQSNVIRSLFWCHPSIQSESWLYLFPDCCATNTRRQRYALAQIPTTSRKASNQILEYNFAHVLVCDTHCKKASTVQILEYNYAHMSWYATLHKTSEATVCKNPRRCLVKSLCFVQKYASIANFHAIQFILTELLTATSHKREEYTNVDTTQAPINSTE